MLWALALQATAVLNLLEMDVERNNKRTIAFFDKLHEKPGYKNVTTKGSGTMLYRVIREGGGSLHPVVDRKEDTPTLHLHMEGWAMNNYHQKEYGALPFLSTYNPPQKFADSHTAAAALKQLDNANVQQRDRARPLWQVHKDMMLGLSLIVGLMVAGDKWEVVLPAELCFFPNQRIAGNFLGGLAVNKFKSDLAKKGEALPEGLDEELEEMDKMQNEMGAEMLGIDGIEEGDGLVFVLELLGTNSTRTVPAQRAATVAYAELEDSRESLDAWMGSVAAEGGGGVESGATPLVLGMLRHPIKGTLMHQFLKDAARTMAEQARRVSFAMVAASRWDHKANKFTVTNLETELKLKNPPGLYVSLDGGAGWKKCDLGRNLKALDPQKAQQIIEGCVAGGKDEL